MQSAGKVRNTSNSARAIGGELKVGPFLSLTPDDGDPMRHVLHADGTIFRGISAEHAEQVRELFDTGLVRELVSAGLLTPSILVEQGMAGYPLAVEQPELMAQNLPTELPPSMRRDAGLTVLRLARLLDDHDFALRDADLSCLVIDRRGSPVFHKFEAILPKGSRKFPYSEFHANFLGPLRLIHGRPELAALVQRADTLAVDEDVSIRWPLARAVLRKIETLGPPGRRLFALYHRLVVLSPFGGLLHCGLYTTFLREAVRESWHRARAGSEAEPVWTVALLSNLEKHLGRLDFTRITQGWTNYYGTLDLAAIASAGDDWRQHYAGERAQALIRVLSKIPKGTLLDVGANNGYFSMLGAHLGFATTAVDFDIGAIDRLYRLLKAAGSPLPIRTLLFDFVTLERKHWARFEADVVFALGFVHHMRRVELLPWAVIAEQLAGFTRKVLITEFKPATRASHSKQEMTEAIAGDYTLEHFVAALERHFSSVETVGDFTAVGSNSLRTMVVCRVKDTA